MRRGGKVFYGWWTALATGIIWFWCYGIWSYSFGTYFEPLRNEFGWSRAEISGAQSLRNVEAGVEGPFGGYLADKYGPRIVSLLGLAISSLGFILLYFMNSLWQWLLIWGLIVSLGFHLSLTVPLTVAIVNCFVKRRGAALGVAKLFMGLGGMALPPIVTYLSMQYGWRTAFLISGIIILSCIPLVWFFVKPRRPEYYGLMPDGVAVKGQEDAASIIKAGQEYAAKFEEVEFTVRQAVRTRAFWVFVSGQIFITMNFPAVSVHGIPHMISLGIDPMVAATTMGVVFGLGAPIRMLGGVLADRSSIRALKYLWILSYILQALGMFVLMNASTLAMIYVFVVLWGAGFGLNHPISPVMHGRYYGRKSIGSISGTMATIVLPASIIAPIYIGWVYDATGSYMSAFTQTMMMIVIAVVITFVFLSPPKEKPEVISDISKRV